MTRKRLEHVSGDCILSLCRYFFGFFFFYIYLPIHSFSVHVYVMVHVEFIQEFVWLVSLLPICWSQRSNSGHKAQERVPLSHRATLQTPTVLCFVGSSLSVGMISDGNIYLHDIAFALGLVLQIIYWFVGLWLRKHTSTQHSSLDN